MLRGEGFEEAGHGLAGGALIVEIFDQDMCCVFGAEARQGGNIVGFAPVIEGHRAWRGEIIDAMGRSDGAVDLRPGRWREMMPAPTDDDP